MTALTVIYYGVLVAALTIVNPSASQTPPSTSQCQHGGTPYCQCPPGFTGQYCQIAINYCNNTDIFTHNKNLTLSLCGPHGTCHYDPNSGSYCVCDRGWTGPFCSDPDPNEVHISNRCQFDFSSAHPNPNCNSTDRCIADDINCHFSPTPASCHPTAKGWCLPEHIAIHLLKRSGF